MPIVVKQRNLASPKLNDFTVNEINEFRVR